MKTYTVKTEVESECEICGELMKLAKWIEVKDTDSQEEIRLAGKRLGSAIYRGLRQFVHKECAKAEANRSGAV